MAIRDTVISTASMFALVLALAVGQPLILAEESEQFRWGELPPIPNQLGLAGPFVGVHNEAIIVAGGANFPEPVWESQKQWHDRIYVLTDSAGKPSWFDGGSLARPLAYGAAVSTELGVVCIGGNDSKTCYSDVYLITWNKETKQVASRQLPSLPKPCAYFSATTIGQQVYVAGGQSTLELQSATKNFWRLDLAETETSKLSWEQLPAWPGPPRAFNLTTAQHNGFTDCVYIMSGRRETDAGSIEFLRDVWEFNPTASSWRKRADAPQCVMAGTSIAIGQSHIAVLGGATGELFFRTDELKDQHPGFPKQAFLYHAITDSWHSAGATPANHVTTQAIRWKKQIVIPSGEIRPRVRSPRVLTLETMQTKKNFGLINYVVLIGYLAAMVGVGMFFSRRTKSSDDFFRGGKRVPWWAAGCSIFATMLSSLTFTGIPSKAYAQDWVYAIGNFTIPLVAFWAVFIALPFFRRIDATSAYEYLEKRFSRFIRLFGSTSFTLFHLFRMAVVMSLTGLALSVATSLSPMQCVLLMGALSIVYCALGGIEAVIWTDTIQTVVLLGGAAIAIALLLMETDGGVAGAWDMATSADKLRIANMSLSPSNAQIALWVIVFGGIGQNLSSYTADQAVVQRYMTTPTPNLAARSIWTNAVLTIPSTLLFFGIGTALFVFYKSHPERLDPTINTDQVFPLFISQEMPIGLSGLIVAGIFAAAQSTISTSMNSSATTLVTDFCRPLQLSSSERGYLQLARGLTVATGVTGTLLALLFIDPDIKSLFDSFLVIIGLFMGVLGGLFLLGILTKRANSTGALCGAIVGAGTMLALWAFSPVNGYLYTTCGITVCVAVGYATSLLTGGPRNDLSGLTIHTPTPALDTK